MDLQIAKNILEKYYNGESTITDEQELQAFLTNYEGNDEELQVAKHLFESLNEDAQETVGIDFDSIVRQKRMIKFKKPVYNYVASIAAVLVMALVIGVLVTTSKQQVVYAYVDGKPITNKQEAIEQSQKALYNISSQLNKGTKGLKHMQNLNKPVELLTVKK